MDEYTLSVIERKSERFLSSMYAGGRNHGSIIIFCKTVDVFDLTRGMSFRHVNLKKLSDRHSNPLKFVALQSPTLCPSITDICTIEYLYVIYNIIHHKIARNFRNI